MTTINRRVLLAMAAALAMLRAATANRRFFWLMRKVSGRKGKSMNGLIVLTHRRHRSAL